MITHLIAAALVWIGVVEAVTIPGCQTVAPAQKNLTGVRTVNVSVPAHPFGIIYAQQTDIAFVALNTSLGVLNTSAFTPVLVHEIPLPALYVTISGATGLALTHNGRYVLVTAFSAALFIVDAAKAIAGNSDAVVGILTGDAAVGASAIEVTVTRDDKYAFVSQEDGSLATEDRGTIEVFELQLPSPGNKTVASGKYIGYLPLGGLVVGTALSPNDRILYATSEIASNTSTTGTLSVVDVEALKSNPSTALISSIPAGCSPVRVLVSRDGNTVWVTARESNRLLAFNAANLLSNANLDAALLASVQVGTSPVGLIFAGANDGRILIADSNRFADLSSSLYANATAGLSIVDVDAALRSEQANLGQIPTGVFPREVAASPDGETILVSVYGSELVQAVDVATLP